MIVCPMIQEVGSQHFAKHIRGKQNYPQKLTDKVLVACFELIYKHKPRTSCYYNTTSESMLGWHQGQRSAHNYVLSHSVHRVSTVRTRNQDQKPRDFPCGSWHLFVSKKELTSGLSRQDRRAWWWSEEDHLENKRVRYESRLQRQHNWSVGAPQL